MSSPRMVLTVALVTSASLPKTVWMIASALSRTCAANGVMDAISSGARPVVIPGLTMLLLELVGRFVFRDHRRDLHREMVPHHAGARLVLRPTLHEHFQLFRWTPLDRDHVAGPE